MIRVCEFRHWRTTVECLRREGLPIAAKRGGSWQNGFVMKALAMVWSSALHAEAWRWPRRWPGSW